MKDISSIFRGNQRNTYVWRMYRIQERLSSEDARLKSIDRSLNLLTNYLQFKRLIGTLRSKRRRLLGRVDRKERKKRTTANIYDSWGLGTEVGVKLCNTYVINKERNFQAHLKLWVDVSYQITSWFVRSMA